MNKDFEKWVGECSEKNFVISYLVYRKPGLYTPYEQKNSFSDESLYEDVRLIKGIIRNAVSISDFDYLLEIQNVEDCECLEDIPEYHSSKYHSDFFVFLKFVCNICKKINFIRRNNYGDICLL